MVECEHFIYGLFNNQGYKLIKSEGVDDILSFDNLRFIIDKTERLKTETSIQMWFPDDEILALTKISIVKDNFGRDGMWNHTILCKICDYVELTQPDKLFTTYFVKSNLNHSLNGGLQPINVTQKQKPLLKLEEDIE